MRKHLSASRSCAGLLVGLAAVLAGTSCGAVSAAHAINGYCAILPDSVGLYVGNPVTQMGYRVGTVKKITANPTNVQVDFSATASRPFPADVSAVVRSKSILADRVLELVGNYRSGPKLQPGQCVPLNRSMTPKSLSEVIGAANNLVNGISPEGSTNVADTVRQLDQAVGNNGAGINQILSASSRLLDNPDRTFSDLKSVVNNVAILSSTLIAIREPMKQVLNDAATIVPYLRDSQQGALNFVTPLGPLLVMLSDMAVRLYGETKLTLNAVSDVLRINTPHTMGWLSAFGGILKSVPWWINVFANHYNHLDYFPLFYRPPMYRIRTPDGPQVCAVMNAANPGSCANVAGQPYGVDLNLLQYVFMQANR